MLGIIVSAADKQRANKIIPWYCIWYCVRCLQIWIYLKSRTQLCRSESCVHIMYKSRNNDHYVNTIMGLFWPYMNKIVQTSQVLFIYEQSISKIMAMLVCKKESMAWVHTRLWPSAPIRASKLAAPAIALPCLSTRATRAQENLFKSPGSTWR